ncbi:hypothetical protein N7453_004327 [Penicillium expansum]|nr:hypothetical protein N7453_004327 [Penicillium expansum]
MSETANFGVSGTFFQHKLCPIVVSDVSVRDTRVISLARWLSRFSLGVLESPNRNVSFTDNFPREGEPTQQTEDRRYPDEQRPTISKASKLQTMPAIEAAVRSPFTVLHLQTT